MTYTDQTKPAAAHSPEPWDCAAQTTMYSIEGRELTMIEVRANLTEAGWDSVAFVEAIWPGAHDNARRIVAAVNACAGIPTEALEQGVIRQLVNALEDLYDWLTPDWQQSNLGDKARAAIAKATTIPQPNIERN